MRAEWANRIVFLLACIGLFIALYIGIHHYAGVSLPCGAAQSGCDEIAKPKNSMFLGIPIAFYGALAYLGLAIMAFARAVLGPAQSPRLGNAMWLVSALGTAISLGLIVWSVRILDATCVWCLASATTMTVLFLVHTFGMLSSGEGAKSLHYALYMGLLGLSVAAAVGFGSSSVQSLKASTSGEVIRPEGEQAELLKRILGDERHVYGNPDAPITIVEFSDLYCPTCASEHAWLKKQLDGPLEGKVRLILRHFPLQSIHPFARYAAAAAEYVYERHPDKFWQFVDTFLSAQDEESLLHIQQIAQLVQIPPEEMGKALQDPDSLRTLLQPVAKDMTDAASLGVDSTPYFFILLPTEGGGTKVLWATGGMIRDIVEGPEFLAAVRQVG
ncbi:MAG: hypothetical protein KatS3mg015_0125 [Fimbriimonadales bacterium]|nr:MAG: hypothetical protein KatS3mg015_0125 [Fimbriimonadales bacterium]